MPPGWRRPQPDPDPGDVTDHDPEDTVDPLHRWRMQMLIKEGFSGADALRLSLAGADWHDATRLLRDGATPDQILRILG